MAEEDGGKTKVREGEDARREGKQAMSHVTPDTDDRKAAFPPIACRHIQTHIGKERKELGRLISALGSLVCCLIHVICGLVGPFAAKEPTHH